MMSQPVIETTNLTKKYGDFTAVDNLNLSIYPGEAFGLLGPNGAGKTTTILMLLGLTDRTSGNIQVLGFDPAFQPLKVKSHVGYMPDMVGFYDELTAFENLVFTAKLNGLSRPEAYRRIDKALNRVGLTNISGKRVGTFSRGMRQRLGVADVLVKQPEMVIMDEPTQGLDPEGAHEFLKMITSLKEEGITILISSHLLNQVQAVCDRVCLFNNGKMVLEGTVPSLAQQVLGKAYRILLEAEGQEEAMLNSLHNLPGVVNIFHEKGHIYEVETKSDLRAEVASQVVNSGARLLKLDVEIESLDEIYTKYFQEVENGSGS
jgi:ABC-2 type transport system ATP-binding protein